MKTSRNMLFALSALSALFAVGTAVAQEGTQDFQNQALSAKTRAQVLAELHEARSAGALDRSCPEHHRFRGRSPIRASPRTR